MDDAEGLEVPCDFWSMYPDMLRTGRELVDHPHKDVGIAGSRFIRGEDS